MFGLAENLASPTLLLVAGVPVLLYLIIEFLRPKLDSQEPPLVRPKIPLIGHVIGLIQHGNSYYAIAG
jgi:hypothetical protein